MTDARDAFKNAVQEYIAVHDQLAEASKQLKDVRAKKTELAELIIDFMKNNEIDECALQDGKLLNIFNKRAVTVKDTLSRTKSKSAAN